MRCDHCPAPARSACLGEGRPAICARAADPSEGGFRKRLKRGAAGSFPPLATQARNLAGSVARFVASGLATTTPEERDRRLSICRGTDETPACPHFDPGPPGRCKLCGCVAKWAARIASKECPDTPSRW